jgi:hypothetical protein
MLDIKDILLLKNLKTIKSKIIVDNYLNNTNFSLIDYGIISYNKVPYLYGIEMCEFNLKEIEKHKSNFQIISRWLNFILNKSVLKFDNEYYTDSIFLFFKDIFIVELNLKNDIFYVNYDRIWLKIKSNFDYNDMIVRVLCNYILEQHFKSMDTTTFSRSKSYVTPLEQHFKSMDTTTFSRSKSYVTPLEQHFKSKDTTTFSRSKSYVTPLEQHFKSKDTTTNLWSFRRCISLEQYFKSMDTTTGFTKKYDHQ